MITHCPIDFYYYPIKAISELFYNDQH